MPRTYGDIRKSCSFFIIIIFSLFSSEDNYQVVDYCIRISVESHIIEEEDVAKWLPNGAPKDCRNLFVMALLENHEGKHVEFIFACESL